MKKTILFILLAMGVSATTVLAQVESGKIFIGGGFGVSSSSSKFSGGGATVDGPTGSSFNFMPNARFFFSDNLAAGLGLGITTAKDKSTNGAGDEVTDKSNFFYINPNIRYYRSFSDNFYAFAEAGLSFGKGSSKNTVAATTTDGPKTTAISVYVAPGLAFFPTEKFAIDFRLNLLRVSKQTDTDPTDSSFKDKYTDVEFGINSLSPSIGIYYIL